MNKLDRITWDNFLDSVEEANIIDENDCWDLTKLNNLLDSSQFRNEKQDIIKLLLENGNLLDNQTKIPDYFFDSFTNLTVVVIPEGVTSIGDSAFSNCDKLTNISLPSTLTNIEKYAFSGCRSLTSISLPEEKDNYI